MGRLRIDRLNGPAAPLIGPGGRVVAGRCAVARSPLARAVGLLATPDLADDEALWLAPCASVHTGFLRARIGCAFLDGDGRVLRVVDPLRPWRVAGRRGALAVVECAAGILSAAGIRPGDVLRLGHEKSLGADEIARGRGVIRHAPAPLPVTTRRQRGAGTTAGGAG